MDMNINKKYKEMSLSEKREYTKEKRNEIQKRKDKQNTDKKDRINIISNTISDFEEGMIFKSYSDLCNALHEKQKTGKSKILQMEFWKQFFEFEKVNGTNGIQITRIYDEPIITNNGNKQASTINSLIEEAIALYLYDYVVKHKTYTRNGVEINEETSDISLTRKKLYETLGFYNDDYESYKNKLEQVTGLFNEYCQWVKKCEMYPDDTGEPPAILDMPSRIDGKDNDRVLFDGLNIVDAIELQMKPIEGYYYGGDFSYIPDPLYIENEWLTLIERKFYSIVDLAIKSMCSDIAIGASALSMHNLIKKIDMNSVRLIVEEEHAGKDGNTRTKTVHRFATDDEAEIVLNAEEETLKEMECVNEYAARSDGMYGTYKDKVNNKIRNACKIEGYKSYYKTVRIKLADNAEEWYNKYDGKIKDRIEQIRYRINTTVFEKVVDVMIKKVVSIANSKMSGIPKKCGVANECRLCERDVDDQHIDLIGETYMDTHLKRLLYQCVHYIIMYDNPDRERLTQEYNSSDNAVIESILGPYATETCEDDYNDNLW